MSRAEITQKFDEIVDFSGVEKFIDTPVKRYSSGMKVRLAFAVAAYLEPEILIIDEVLAVGDAAFQRKCLGKMGEVARSGRTVLFVSHNMGAVPICVRPPCGLTTERSVPWVTCMPRRRRISRRVRQCAGSSAALWRRSGTGDARIMQIQLQDTAGHPRDSFMIGESIVVTFALECYRLSPSFGCGFTIKSVETGLDILDLFNEDCGLIMQHLDVGSYRFRVEIPQCMLYPSSYSLTIWTGIFHGALLDVAHDAVKFEMYQGNVTDSKPTP